MRVQIRGTVFDSIGMRPLAGALVWVVDVGSTLRSGANGGFAITDASMGTQTVEARMIGYTPHPRTVQVKASGTDAIVLVLPVQRAAARHGALVQVGGNEPSSLIIDDFVTRDDVAAMEVYARGSAVPPEFAGGNTGCGVIAVWSRRAAGAASVAPQGIDRKP